MPFQAADRRQSEQPGESNPRLDDHGRPRAATGGGLPGERGELLREAMCAVARAHSLHCFMCFLLVCGLWPAWEMHGYGRGASPVSMFSQPEGAGGSYGYLEKCQHRFLPKVFDTSKNGSSKRFLETLFNYQRFLLFS